MKDKQLLFGRKPVVDALKERTQLDRIILQRGVQGHIASEIRELAKGLGVPIQVVPKEAMKKYGHVNHQGVIGIMPLIPYQDLEKIVPFLFEQGKIPLILMLDHISDVRNFGAIARSAEILGVDALIIPEKGTARLNDVALKISAGALRKIPVCRSQSLIQTLTFLQTAGLEIVAAEKEGSVPLHTWDASGPICLIMGAEGKGIHPKLLAMANHLVSVPQKGETESFNVSVATGIMLYEINRQRSG